MKTLEYWVRQWTGASQVLNAVLRDADERLGEEAHLDENTDG